MTRRQLVFLRTLTLSLVVIALTAHAAFGSGDQPTDLRVRTTAIGDSGIENPSQIWPVDPEVAESQFAHGSLRIVSERYAGRGVTGARRFEIDLPDLGQRVQAKWKPMPRRLDGINNSPRREIAAYQVQTLFLDPENYVVPTSTARCLYAREFENRKLQHNATFPDADCELGLLSLWLDNVTLPDPLMDLDRFQRDAIYAQHLADFNLATYLMKHQDGRKGNFLVSKNDAVRRVFAIDNGVAFSGIFYNWFVPNWKKLRVPALRRASVERLRGLTQDDLEFLGVVAQLEWQPERGVINVTPTENLDPDDGARHEGQVIQLGLEEDEIENLWERIEHLIEDVDQGKMAVF